MKKILILILISLPYLLRAQFVVTSGTQGMTIKAYATVCIDSLIISPASNVTITNNQLTRSATNQPIGTGNTINRVYTFSSPITVNGNIGFKYDDAELAGNTESSLNIVYSASNSGTVWITTTGSMLNTTTNAIVQNVSNASISRISASSFSTLPVTLIQFTARKEEQFKASILQWEVANERGFDQYQIERSPDGKIFKLIGSVQATANTKYNFTDRQPINGENFYRLKLMDLDGAFSYSPVCHLNFIKNNLSIDVYPNPVVNESITIHSNNQNLMNTVGQVIAYSGKVITTFKITSGKTYINAQNWAAGMYILKLANGVTFKIFKK